MYREIEKVWADDQEVQRCGHADAALAICEARVESIHALFTDIQMPGPMNGLELAQHVSARWPWIAFLITSRRTPHGGVAVSKPVFIQTV